MLVNDSPMMDASLFSEPMNPYGTLIIGLSNSSVSDMHRMFSEYVVDNFDDTASVFTSFTPAVETASLDSTSIAFAQLDNSTSFTDKDFTLFNDVPLPQDWSDTPLFNSTNTLS